MNDMKLIITERSQQPQMLMYRVAFQDYRGGRQSRNPRRGQGRVLAILKLKSEISQRDLPCLLGMSKQSLTEFPTKLGKNGYTTREPSQKDKRALTIKLMEEGMKAAESVEQKPSDTENALDCLNGEELTAFSGSLQRIIERYEEQLPEADYEQHRRVMGVFMMQHEHRRGFHVDSPDGRESPFAEQRPNNRPGRHNRRGEL